MDPKQFNDAFTCWWQSIGSLLHQEHIAIDGKTLRASYDKALEKGAIHMVSAWAVQNGIVLGQVKTLDVTFNEDKCRVRKDHAPELDSNAIYDT